MIISPTPNREPQIVTALFVPEKKGKRGDGALKKNPVKC